MTRTPANQFAALYELDRRLFLVLIPAINLINYYLTYTHLPVGWRLPATFLIDTLQGYAAWWVARSLIRRLDSLLPYEKAPVRRILLQLVATTVAGLLVIALSTEYINGLVSERPVPAEFYSHHLFLFAIWFLVVNGIYIGLYFYFQSQQTAAQIPAATSVQLPPVEGLLVRSGRQTVHLSYADIRGFWVEGDYTLVGTHDRKQYVADASLDKLEMEVPAGSFFRANRQYLLHRHCITGFERQANGKLLLQLRVVAHFPESVAISRTKAPAFRKWFSAEPVR